MVMLLLAAGACGTEAAKDGLAPIPLPAAWEPEPVPAEEPADTEDPAEPPAVSDAAPEPTEPEPAQATVEPGLPMLLDFTRDHCLPCDIMAPWVGELRRKYEGRVAIQEINIDRPGNRELGLFFKTKSIPTQVYVDAMGREVSRHVGLATLAQMERTLERLGFAGKR